MKIGTTELEQPHFVTRLLRHRSRVNVVPSASETNENSLRHLSQNFDENRSKPDNDCLQTFLATALDIPCYQTFAVGIRLTTASSICVANSLI